MIRQALQDRPGTDRGLIDLHLHTTASDGRCTPHELVDRAADAGLAVMAVTDHDTTAAVAEAAAHARARGIAAVPGIEITAVEQGSDVHMLGYFIDADDAALQRFLGQQRRTRLDRLQAIADRLAALGMPVDVSAVMADARSRPAAAVGRPQIARAMIAAGYVSTIKEAFDEWLSPGRPAFVPRTGSTPETVIEIVHAAGGLVSLAHPGRTRIDPRIEALRRAGLDALEVFHSDHDPDDVRRYSELAARLGLLCTGGSDFHADPARDIAPGSSSLPAAEWRRLLDARARHA